MAASPAQIEQLYRDRYTVFLDGLTRVSGSHEGAREIVQEAFACALRKRRQFRGDGNLEAWIWRIAVNEALKSRRALRERWDEKERAAPAPLDRDDDVREAVRSLPPRRRLVVFLRYFADLSYEEIARVCDLSEGTVAATLSQSHAELLEYLRPEGARL